MDLLVPELQKRGLMWDDYAAPGGAFRENVLGRKELPDESLCIEAQVGEGGGCCGGQWELMVMSDNDELSGNDFSSINTRFLNHFTEFSSILFNNNMTRLLIC